MPGCKVGVRYVQDDGVLVFAGVYGARGPYHGPVKYDRSFPLCSSFAPDSGEPGGVHFFVGEPAAQYVVRVGHRFDAYSVDVCMRRSGRYVDLPSAFELVVLHDGCDV